MVTCHFQSVCMAFPIGAAADHMNAPMCAVNIIYLDEILRVMRAFTTHGLDVCGKIFIASLRRIVKTQRNICTPHKNGR